VRSSYEPAILKIEADKTGKTSVPHFTGLYSDKYNPTTSVTTITFHDDAIYCILSLRSIWIVRDGIPALWIMRVYNPQMFTAMSLPLTLTFY